MKTAVIAALIGSAAAFAPSKTGPASTSLNAFENELGAQVSAYDICSRGRRPSDVLADRFTTVPSVLQTTSPMSWRDARLSYYCVH